jgi:hypothetical protein
LRRQPARGGLAAGNAGFGDRQYQLLHRHVLAQTRLEHLLAHVLRRDHRFIAFLGKLAVLLQRRNRCDELHQLLVADDHLGLPRLLGEQALRHQRIEHGAAHLRRIEGCRISLPPSWVRMRSCCSRRAACNSWRVILPRPTLASSGPRSTLRT